MLGVRPLIRVDLKVINYEIGYPVKLRFQVRVYEVLTGRGIPRVPVNIILDGQVIESVECDDNGFAYVTWSFRKTGSFRFIAEVMHLGRLWKSDELPIDVRMLKVESYDTYEAKPVPSTVTVNEKSFTVPFNILIPIFDQEITVTFIPESNGLPFRIGRLNGEEQVSPMFKFVPRRDRDTEVYGYYGYVPTKIDVKVIERSIGCDAASVVLETRIIDEVLGVACPNFPFKVHVDAAIYEEKVDLNGVHVKKMDLGEGVYTIYSDVWTGAVDNKIVASDKLPLRVCKTLTEIIDYQLGTRIPKRLPINIMGIDIECPTFYIPFISGERARIKLPLKVEVDDPYLHHRFMDVEVDGIVFDVRDFDVDLPIGKIRARYCLPHILWHTIESVGVEIKDGCIFIRSKGLKARFKALHDLRFDFENHPLIDYVDGLKDGIISFATEKLVECRSCRGPTVYGYDTVLGEFPLKIKGRTVGRYVVKWLKVDRDIMTFYNTKYEVIALLERKAVGSLGYGLRFAIVLRKIDLNEVIE